MNVTGWEVLMIRLLSTVLQSPEVTMGLSASQPQTEVTQSPTSQQMGVNQDQDGQNYQKEQIHHKPYSQRKGKKMN